MHPNITVSVETRHYKAADSYCSICSCPLAMAIKELFPEKRVLVGTDTASIGKIDYNLENWENYEFTSNTIEEMITVAKNDEEIETKIVTLVFRCVLPV